MQILFLSLGALAVVVLIVVRLLRGRVSTDRETAVPGRNVSDVVAFTITLEVDEKTSLFILLGKDGCINRMGSGTAENLDGELFIGNADPSIFLAVRSHLTPGMLRSLAQGFRMPTPRGASCKLTVIFQFEDKSSLGISFFYGSESEGPPKDVAAFVTSAVTWTNALYENFRQNALRR
jgi:hypothetical protein